MYISLYSDFWWHYSMLTHKSLVSIHHCTADPLYSFCPPSTPFLSGDYQSVLCFFVFFFCFIYLFIYLFIFNIPHGSEIIWYLSFSIWLISLSVIPSNSFNIIANGKISSFLWPSSIPLCVYHIFFIHSSID